MNCPFCNAPKNYVLETRPSPNGVRRRHECRSCRQTFASYNGSTVMKSALSPLHRAMAGLLR